jgi:glycosyltransferase involved in cell wall biosynthesis
MLYQGALNVGRGLEVCMEAMQQLPEWKFWLAGEGDISTSLQAQSKRLGLDTQVKFLGWVKPEDLPALMSKAMISINLRERGSLNDYYSLPNKFFDAIHAGLPSIHMNYPEYAHIISKYPCALLLDEVDVQKIVSAVERITHEPEMWNKMVDACRLAAKEYTWAEEEKKLLAMYSNL